MFFFQFCLSLRKQKHIPDISTRVADLDYPLMSLWSCVNIKMQSCAGVLLTARKEQNHPCKTIWRGGTGPEIAPLSWTHSSAISSLQLQWCPTNAKAFKEAKEQGFILQAASEQNIFPKKLLNLRRVTVDFPWLCFIVITVSLLVGPFAHKLWCSRSQSAGCKWWS